MAVNGLVVKSLLLDNEIDARGWLMLNRPERPIITCSADDDEREKGSDGRP